MCNTDDMETQLAAIFWGEYYLDCKHFHMSEYEAELCQRKRRQTED